MNSQRSLRRSSCVQGIKARQWGRKPLPLIAFGVLPIRGIFYTLTSSTSSLIAIQVLDGVGAAIFGVVSVLVIADLTQGTGRFNLTLGAVTTAVGIGAALSQSIAGGIVHRFGYGASVLGCRRRDRTQPTVARHARDSRYLRSTGWPSKAFARFSSSNIVMRSIGIFEVFAQLIARTAKRAISLPDQHTEALFRAR